LPTCPLAHIPKERYAILTCAFTEIYKIVSSKALDSGDGAQAAIGAGTNISLSKAADDGSAKGGKCC
jgi:hypothetical protein